MKAKRSENFILQFNIATWHELYSCDGNSYVYGSGGGKGTLATRLFAALLEIFARVEKLAKAHVGVQWAKHATEKRHFKQLFLSFC